jgi:3-hydroxyacyl-[acyl-carrier-protein] dehydratase
MPPQTLYDLSQVDLNGVSHDIEAIRAVNPQRGDMEHLNAIVALFEDGVIGVKDVRDDEFWVAGHIPGRPLLPGVIMIEAAAQAASFYTKVVQKWEGFIGFGGVDAVKFRQAVPPGSKLYIMLKVIWKRHRRICCNAQGMVNGNIVFEGQITGAQM